MDDIVARLKDIGFNTYEAKVYMALLKHHPATGYEISKDSGVPQARAYDTLKALETRGVVMANAGKPVTYLPISPVELLDQWERGMNQSLQVLRQALPNLSGETVEPILNLRGKDAVIKRVEEMINGAREQLYVEIFRPDAMKFESAFRHAAKRGVKLHIVGHEDVPFEFCTVHAHKAVPNTHAHPGGRWLIMSADGVEGLVGNLKAGERIPKAVYTRNEGMVFVITELILHDMFILDIEKRLGPQLEAEYGTSLSALRHQL